MNYPESKTMFQICTEINDLFHSDDPLNCINLIDKDEYKELREGFSAIFEVGEAKPVFEGELDDDTEHGDVTDIIGTELLELYPPSVVGDPSTFVLNIEQRKQLRDQVIEALDNGLQGI